MKKRSLVVTAILAVVSVCAASPGQETGARLSKPNIVPLLSDDQGYGDVGRQGNPILKTPNMDRLYRYG